MNMSNEDFEREINKRFYSGLMSKIVQIENDMSKYDKAQHKLIRLLENKLLRKLGMPEYLVEIWHSSYFRAWLKDKRNGMAFETEYQRKSGDASTFFGNTVVLLCILLACYDINDILFMILAGDDSVIFFLQNMLVSYDPSARIADLFNMECKLLDIMCHIFVQNFW